MIKKIKILAGEISGQEGAALITVLLFIVILTGLGIASIMTSSTEVKISRNDRLNKLALDYANAGVQVALARLDEKTLPWTFGTFTSLAKTASGGPWEFDSNFNGLNATINPVKFFVHINYRTEDGGHWVKMDPPPPTGLTREQYYTGVGMNDHEVVGYSVDCGYPKSPNAHYEDAWPVFQITSTGTVMSGTNVIATAKVLVEVTKNRIDLSVPGAVSSVNCPTKLQGGGSISGTATIPALSTNGGCTTHDTANPIKTSPASGTAPTPIDINTMITNLLQNDHIDVAPGAFGGNYGGYNVNTALCRDPKVIHVTGTVTAGTGDQGFGIMIVEGDLITNGKFDWKGLIIVRGKLDCQGGGSDLNLEGGVISTDTEITGSPTITYNQTLIDKIKDSVSRSKIMTWRIVYDQE
ncbi:MAG TPA: pilus assembly PilX N-terminal domain-containing protein [Nitrospirota bacterium]|jgi:hypothetical protein